MYVEMTMEATSAGQMLRARPWGLGGAATSTVVGQAEEGATVPPGGTTSRPGLGLTHDPLQSSQPSQT